MADTKLTVKEIELALRNSGLWNKRNDVMLPGAAGTDGFWILLEK